jgi:hypothetical protein
VFGELKAAILALSLILGFSSVAGAPAVGVAGPVQDFTILRGENLTSYVRVYNEGNWSGSYGVSIEGNVSQIATLGLDYLALGAGENRKVTITYTAPAEGVYYEGLISVSLEGSQVVPGVTRGIRVVIQEPVGNRPPRVRIVFPEEGEELSGVVDVVVEADDPDGDKVTVSIYLDGESVSNSSTWVWRTGDWPDGEHLIRAVAGDGELESEHDLTVVVENPERSWSLYVMIGVVLAVIALAAIVVWKRRPEG